MKIAIEGCCHGELDKIYETLQFLEKEQNIKIDLLIICGDFQAVRNKRDLECMAVPKKYQLLNTFYKYYSGEKEAPVLTIFVGGNHEASNYLQELPYGGFVAPKIYYMGYAGVVKFRGLRIAGLSGIYNSRHYNLGHYERLPYDDNSKRSVYHVRNLEVFRLKQLKEPVDIMLTHDWPANITDYGNVHRLLKRKAFLKEDIDSGKLGSPPGEALLHHLKPMYWFAAHLHVKFSAVVQHEESNGQQKFTKFLSLDKCLPKRDFLQVIDVADPEPGTSPHLELDPDWLVILKLTNHLLSLKQSRVYMPGVGSGERYDFTVTEADLQSLREDLGGIFEIPRNFERTAPPHNPHAPPPQLQMYRHPWTSLLCEVLGITDPNSVFLGLKEVHSGPLHSSPSGSPDTSVVSDDDVPDTSTSYLSDVSFTASSFGTSFSTSLSQNPAEISIDGTSDSDDEEQQNLSQISEIGQLNSSLSEIGSQEDRLDISQSDDRLDNSQSDDRLDNSQSDDRLDNSQSDDRLDNSQSDERLNISQSDKLNNSQSNFINDRLDSSQSECLENSQSESDHSTKDGADHPKPKRFKRRNQSLYSSCD